MLIFLFVVSLIDSLHAEPNVKVDSTKSLIQRAQELVLQQDRVGAVQVLTKAIEKETDKKTKDKLLTNLNQITEIFLTDKAQKIFEQANFLSKTKPSEAIAKYQEAQLIEPTNTKILLNLGRAHLSAGQCNEAYKAGADISKLNSYNDEGFLVRVQAQTCLQKYDLLDAEIQSRPVQNAEIQFQILLAQTQEEYFKTHYTEALKTLQKAAKMNDRFPETYYWENQILLKMNKPATESAKKYVKACKLLTKEDQIRFQLEPRLCQEYKAIEKKLDEQASNEDIANEKQN